MKQFLILVTLLTTIQSSFAEECWISTKQNEPGANGYATVQYTTVNIGGDTRHDLVCSGQNNLACVWPANSGYSGPPPIFVPGDQQFYGVNGLFLNFTGVELNNLLFQKYLEGTFNGIINVQGGQAIFSFSMAPDLSITQVKHLN